LVRTISFHADLATKVYRAQKDGNNYGGKWWDRLRQINRIKKHVNQHQQLQLHRVTCLIFKQNIFFF
jgi:hypothetical protein